MGRPRDLAPIGPPWRSSEFFFNGTIDEVRLFSRALSQSEVQAEMMPMMPSVPGLSAVGMTLAALAVEISWTCLALRGFGVVDRKAHQTLP